MLLRVETFFSEALADGRLEAILGKERAIAKAESREDAI
jgi:hypothetical protein